jgi:hypothetical protein
MGFRIEYLATNLAWQNHGEAYALRRDARAYMGRLRALNLRHTYRVVEFLPPQA